MDEIGETRHCDRKIPNDCALPLRRTVRVESGEINVGGCQQRIPRAATGQLGNSPFQTQHVRHSHPIETTFRGRRGSVHVCVQVQVNQAQAGGLSQTRSYQSERDGAVSPDNKWNVTLTYGLRQVRISLLDAPDYCFPVLCEEIPFVWTPTPDGKVSNIHYRQTPLAKHLGKARLSESFGRLFLARAVRPQADRNPGISNCPAHRRSPAGSISLA